MFGLIFLILSSVVQAHEEHHHTVKEVEQSKAQPRAVELQAIYLRDIKPIFVKKCFDCHSSSTNYPWYHSLPVVKGIIDKDIVEARKHLDMSADFPFKGHGTLDEDLQAIGKSVRDHSMPPKRYRMLHPSSKMSDEELKAIEAWIRNKN